MIRVTSVTTGRPGAPGYSSFYFGGSTSGEAVAASVAVDAAWETIKGYMTSGSTITTGPLVEQVDPSTGNVVATFSVPTLTCTTTGNAPLPASTQGLLRYRTGQYVNGREIRGRTFIPWLANDAQLGGIPSAGFLTTLGGGFFNALTQGPATGGFVVYSPKNAQAAAVTAGSAWTQFAVLRSRRD